MDTSAIQMKSTPLAVALAFLGFFEAIFLTPVLENVAGVRMVNPIWGSLYGLGAFVWQETLGHPAFGFHGFIYFVVTMVVYPILLFSGTVEVLRRLFMSGSRTAIFVLLISVLSLCIVVELSSENVGAVRKLPLFFKYIE